MSSSNDAVAGLSADTEHPDKLKVNARQSHRARPSRRRRRRRRRRRSLAPSPPPGPLRPLTFAAGCASIACTPIPPSSPPLLRRHRAATPSPFGHRRHLSCRSVVQLLRAQLAAPTFGVGQRGAQPGRPGHVPRFVTLRAEANRWQPWRHGGADHAGWSPRAPFLRSPTGPLGLQPVRRAGHQHDGRGDHAEHRRFWLGRDPPR